MAHVGRTVERPIRIPGGSRLALVGYAALVGVVGLWTWRALHDPFPYDFAGFYTGGQVAWATAHPEHLAGWTGTPLFALVMAITSRVLSGRTATHGLSLLNAGLTIAAVAAVMQRLRGALSPWWWWITAAALVSFGPIMSTVWWKQVNIIALVPAVAGFELLRRRRIHPGAALIGLSVAFKPLAILLPFVLLARRETRRAGAWALVYGIGLTVIAQGLLAVHAHSASALNPLLALQNFDNKTALGPGSGSCWVENFAPGSLLCRLGGTHDQTVQRVIVYAGVALLGAWVIGALRDRKATSWEVFAFTCAISPMVSPFEWSHYQIMLAPLFVLLVVRFTQDGADVGEWAGLAVAFVLASVMWRPYDTPIDVARLGLPAVWTPFSVQLADAAQFAQYVLVVTGLLWYKSRRGPARVSDENLRPQPHRG